MSRCFSRLRDSRSVTSSACAIPASAFSEINDSDEQALRFAAQASERDAGAVEAEPGDPDYVEAMSYGMAPNGGCGVGVDRLAMVLLGKDAIRDVILFPTLRSRD